MVSQKISFLTYRRLFLYHLRGFHVKPESIVIVSAVRTPWGRYQGQLSSTGASHLVKVAVESAVKQSAVPVEQIKQIYMAESPATKGDEADGSFHTSLLKKAVYTKVTTKDEVDVKSFLRGLEDLTSKKADVVVVGATQSASQSPLVTNKSLKSLTNDKETFNSHKNAMERFAKAQREGLFDSEIVPVQVLQQSGKRKLPLDITQDEVNYKQPEDFINYSDGAAALVLSTVAKAEELNLKPLAIIKDFAYGNTSSGDLLSSQKCIDQLLSKDHINPEEIRHWEIDDSKPQLISFLQQHLSLNVDLINLHGDCLIFGKSLAASLARMLTHVSHSLKSSQLGCIVSSNSNESLAILIQNFPSPSSAPGSLPQLTLYTKDPCPLCDMLLEELEMNFSGEYELEKVYIDTKENVRFLRLYRHDIPVVFLNGQFLCMHRLNSGLLRRKLDLLKE